MQQITPCLWFNDQAEEAARFYTSIFTNANIGEITHDGEGSPQPKGSVLTVRFQLHGQEFLALNGGPQCTFTEGRVVHRVLRDTGGTGPDVGAAVRGR
jgi:predicted 3-demethylubiquinone-9 3-methyltransferase (glyoxalase superfamily)